MRPSKACSSCRSSKRGCRLQLGKDSCVRCTSLQIPCSLLGRISPYSYSQPAAGLTEHYQDIQARSPSLQYGNASSPSEASDRTYTSTALNKEFCQEAVSKYFTVIHDKHHSLFHQPTFEDDLANNAVPHVILSAVVALGSRFSKVPLATSTERRHHGDHYAEQAHSKLDLRVVSIMTIQACILLGTLSFVEGRTESESVYYTAANRMALLLDLPRRPAGNELDRQINLRVWWSLYMIDIWSSLALCLPRTIFFLDDVQLPADEEYFLSLTHQAPCSDHETHGIWAEMARLTGLWARVQELNRASVNGELSSSQLQEDVGILARQLDEWQANIPETLAETTENLDRFTSLGLGTAFAALHLGYHYYNEVLFYQFLAESHYDTTSSVKTYADQCKAHAESFCDLLYACERKEDCECLYVMVGHMLTITSTIFVHELLFSSDDEKTSHARSRLEENFRILTKLQSYWIMLDRAMSRLQVFHHACTESIEQSFRMDQWMLRFILEHGNSMPEKFTSLKSTA
ncbi:hypothetical protein G7046_g2588 [Stylonectria norvegica]|nr:hypothetical protein G7046_g2588 [Stylonectria norvegica]